MPSRSGLLGVFTVLWGLWCWPVLIHARSTQALHHNDISRHGGIMTAKTVLQQTDKGSIDVTKEFQSFPIMRNMIQTKGRGPYTIAYDGVNRRLFFSVPPRPTDTSPVPHNCIVCIDYKGSNSGYMYLNNFGRANVSFAAEPVGNDTRLWIDIDPDEAGASTKLAAFMWEREKELHNPSPELTTIAPVEGANDYSSTYDPATGRLLVRYRYDNEHYMIAYDSTRAAAQDLSEPLSSFKIPKLNTAAEATRGYAAFGQNLYILTGNPSSTGDFPSTLTEISNINMNTLELTQDPSSVSLGKYYSATDPLAQGLGLYYVEGQPQKLLLGVVGTSSKRMASVFSNSALNV